MFKECYTEISYYFGIGPIEEIVWKRRDKFISSYGASDNSLCQLLYREVAVHITFTLYARNVRPQRAP